MTELPRLSFEIPKDAAGFCLFKITGKGDKEKEYVTEAAFFASGAEAIEITLFQLDATNCQIGPLDSGDHQINFWLTLLNDENNNVGTVDLCKGAWNRLKKRYNLKILRG